ncbi:MAG TPA: DUF5692 family protein [Prolixibacteraceae bacterium]|nr:DUF5692 family protein [Prolixibacteraceae bacterium]
MLLFESITWQTSLMWFVVLLGLMLVNDITRRSKWLSILVYIALPIILTFTLWQHTAANGSSSDDWFHWLKTYSSLAGVVGFMYLRYNKKAQSSKFWLMFPALILSINIMEAVLRDFEVYRLYSGNLYGSVVNTITLQGGSWNIMNGIAGILNIIALSGWVGIFVTKGKYNDMVWTDQLWWWIISYDLWNFAYTYNCVGDHAFYVAALIISPTIAAFVMGKGAWLQHRAQTLGLWMMFVMSFPSFQDTSIFAVKSSHNSSALFVISALALASNVALILYHTYKIVKSKRNPFTQEVYIDEPAYAKVVVRKQEILR